MKPTTAFFLGILMIFILILVYKIFTLYRTYFYLNETQRKLPQEKKQLHYSVTRSGFAIYALEKHFAQIELDNRFL